MTFTTNADINFIKLIQIEITIHFINVVIDMNFLYFIGTW